MIDNIEKIKPLLKFESSDDFYYIQVFQRRKDNPDSLEKNTVNIKDYFIHSFEYLDKKYEEIKKLCTFFNARAGIRLNKRSYRKVAYRTLNNITAQMMQDDFHSTKQSFSKACGQCHNETNKKWIIDIDEADLHKEDDICEVINILCLPEDDSKLYVRLPSKSGIHLISKPFNMQQFSMKFPEIDIHKDNPTTLFCLKG